MPEKFDLFKIETNGTVVWRSACDGLEESHRRAAAFSAIERADYLILDLTTGEKIKVPFSPKNRHSRPAINCTS